MIDARELRIGNLTQQGDIKNFWEKGVHIGFGKCYEFNELEPIPLTEELLLSLGFELNEDLGDMRYYQMPKEKTGFGICFDHEEIAFYLFNIKGIVNLIYDESFLQYLHQLQNLYQCICGKELFLINE